MKPKGNEGFINNLNDINGHSAEREDKFMMHQITFRHEAKINAYGKKRNGNKRPIIAIDLHESYNSCEDFRETYHVCHNSLYRALHPENGKEIYIKVYNIDENGKKICIGKTRVSYTAHSETVVGKLVSNGKEIDKKLSKEKERNNYLEKENHALKCENNELRNANNTYKGKTDKIDKMEAIESTVKEIKNRKLMRERALEEARQLEVLIAESEQKLNELLFGGNNNA
jgi:hypothetical protein